MHVNVDAEALASAITYAVSPLKSDNKLLTFSRLSAYDSKLVIETTDNRVYSQASLPAEVKSNGICLMRTKALKAATGSRGLVQIKGNGLIIRGRSQYSIDTQTDVDVFPRAQTQHWKTLNISPVDFLNAAMNVFSASDKEDCRPMCRAINVRKDFLWASDGIRLARVAIGLDGVMFSIPATFIPILKSRIKNMTHLSLGYHDLQKPATFFRVTGPSNALTTHLVDESYTDFDINNLIPNPCDASAKIKIDCKAMCNVLMRSRALTTDLKGVCILTLRLETGKATLGNRENSYTECLVENGAAISYQGEIMVAFNCLLFLDIIRSITTDHADVYLYGAVGKPLLIIPADKNSEQVAHVLASYRL